MMTKTYENVSLTAASGKELTFFRSVHGRVWNSIVGIAALAAGLPAIAAGAEEKPNFVVIMCDDMGYSDIGCYGGEIETPNLDSLAANGIRYSQMYNTSKCTTSRSSLLTGRYVTNKTFEQNYKKGPTIGEVLKSAGYRTLWSGKNHSPIRPPERGFDRFYGFQGGACSFWNPGDKLLNGGRFPHIKTYEWMVNDTWLPKYIPEDPDYYMTDAITDNALNWLDEYSSEDKPFLLYLAYNSPHWPLHAPDKDIAKYKGVYDGGYQKIQQNRYKKMVQNGVIDPATAPLNPQKIVDWNTLSAKEKKLEAQRMEIHAAMVDNMDQNIGRVIGKLKERGQLDNTLILFFSDNGSSAERDTRAFENYKPTGDEKVGSVMSYECIGREWAMVLNTPLAKYKRTSHEGGICTPMIAHWPNGISKTGTWNDQPVHLVDIMSTLTDLGDGVYPKKYNGKPSKPVEGISLRGTFQQQNVERPITMGFSFNKGKALRDGKWKLVSYNNTPWELYDMSVDRTETRNRASEMPEKVQSMEKQYKVWETRCGGARKKKRRK